jgi:hypothetical protein
MANKKTAVEWYELRSRKLIHKYIDKEICIVEFLMLHHNLFNSIANMEKNQIQHAFASGKLDAAEQIFQGTESKDFTQYYEQTYGGNK